MPGLSGVDFLDWLIPNYPIPVIMLSSYTQTGAEITLEALDKGAMDFVQKPDGSEEDFLRMLEELVTKIKKLAGLKLLKRQTPQNQSLPQSQKNTLTKREKPGTIQLIAIGASTGGTQAIDSILRNLPSNQPVHEYENFILHTHQSARHSFRGSVLKIVPARATDLCFQ